MAWAGRTPVNPREGPGAAAGLRRAQEVQLRLGQATGVWQYPGRTESRGCTHSLASPLHDPRVTQYVLSFFDHDKILVRVRPACRDAAMLRARSCASPEAQGCGSRTNPGGFARCGAGGEI